MAAPSGTIWGSVSSNGYGKLGIYISASNSNTQTTLTVQVWLALKWNINDSNNSYTFSYTNDSGGTSYGANGTSLTLKFGTSSGAGWADVSQKQLASYTITYTRGTSAKTVSLYSILKNLGSSNYSVSVSTSYTIPAKPSYTISYNANGGSGAPSSQTKWYGTNITLSNTKPTRTGYTFKGWATSPGGSVAYASGATYSSNASVTLYAVWQIITYTISYNANGGTGAPGNQTKTYGVTLTLSSTKPTRTNYNFKGWATSSGGSVAYAAGGSYTANYGATLYAVWELAYEPPTITNSKAVRCNSDGTANEIGTYAKVTFNWSCCQLTGSNAVSSIKITVGSSETPVSASGTSGSVSQVVGGSLSIESSYTFTVTVTDSKGGSTPKPITLPTAKFVVDFKSGGTGISFGKVAELNNTADFGFHTVHRASTTLKNGVYLETENASGTTRRVVGTNSSNQTFFGFDSYDAGEGETYFDGNVVNIRSKGAIKITSPTAGLSGREFGVNKMLAGTAWYMNETQTLTLSQPISAQPNGIIIIWSAYDAGGAHDWDFSMFFIPKYFPAHFSGRGTVLSVVLTDGAVMSKYVYITDTTIKGYSVNQQNKTANGNLIANASFVLRLVIGV